jgi:hypothetical protein
MHYVLNQSRWPRDLRRSSAAARRLRLRVRIPPGSWMIVCCYCCVLSGRSLWDELITSPEETYRLWRVVVCHLETSWMRRPWPTWGCNAKNKQNYILMSISLSWNRRYPRDLASLRLLYFKWKRSKPTSLLNCLI